MTNRSLRFLAIAWAIFLTSASGVSAQDTRVWSDMDCSQSKIVAPAGLKCRATQEFSGSSSAKFSAVGAGQGSFKSWNSFGSKDGNRFYFLVGEGIGGRSNQTISNSLEKDTRSSSPQAKDGQNFSAPGSMNGADFLRFTSGAGEACAAIRKHGSVRGPGYAWVLWATKCVPKGKAISDQEIGEFIAASDFRG